MKSNKRVKIAWIAVSILLWVGIWQIVSSIVGKQILIASPISVAVKLAELAITAEFWKSIGLSLFRIFIGLMSGTLMGCLLAMPAAKFVFIRTFLSVPVKLMKTVPVASFIIVVLIWAPSKYLSIIISFIMVFPIIYMNVLEGILQTDNQLLEMAEVFRMPFAGRVRYIYAPQVKPYLSAGVSLAIGFAWKSGIAAEVIGLPKGTIGEKLYYAKIYLNTPELFAWTIAIVAVSFLLECIVRSVLKKKNGLPQNRNHNQS